MRLIFLGDVVGRSGREAVYKYLPELKEKYRPDAVVVNGENAASGFGITNKIAKEFFANGVDIITLGNHSWDQREMLVKIQEDPRLVRPANYPEGTPGRGCTLLQTPKGKKLLVINVMGRLFMDPLDDPFAAVDKIVTQYQLGKQVDAILVDVHGETTSEKMAMGHFLDGRASFVVGTHTHIPTADTQILPHGTAYQTDAGMCGDYNSVIGMEIEAPIHRFTKKIPGPKLTPALGDGTVCGTLIVTDDATGLAKFAHPLRLGARLHSALPELDDM